MTVKEVKRYLNSYQAIERNIESIKDTMDILNHKLISVKAVTVSDMPKGKGKCSIDFSDIICQIEDKQREYHIKMAQSVVILNNIDTLINKLENPTYRAVIREHYINGNPWWKVCTIVGYEWAQIHRIHAKCLEIMKDDTK